MTTELHNLLTLSIQKEKELSPRRRTHLITCTNIQIYNGDIIYPQTKKYFHRGARWAKQGLFREQTVIRKKRTLGGQCCPRSDGGHQTPHSIRLRGNVEGGHKEHRQGAHSYLGKGWLGSRWQSPSCLQGMETFTMYKCAPT